MIAVMGAKWVGDGLGKAIYEELLEVKSIPFLEYHPPSHVLRLNVTEHMSPAICVKDVENISTVIKVTSYQNVSKKRNEVEMGHELSKKKR